jgi:hypothetical protein
VAIGAGGYFLGREAKRDVQRTGSTVTSIKNGIFEGGKGSKAGTFGQAVHMFVFLILLPVALLVLAVFITLVFRQGLLIFLAMVSPIACALYILPSTDKYFKKWWELFSKTLLMYPIIMAIFALSDILASIIFNNNHNLPGLLAGLIAMFAPLALIPFSFKFAGGAMTAIYGALTTGRGKLSEMNAYKRQREKAKMNWQEQKTLANTSIRRKDLESLKTNQQRLDTLRNKADLAKRGGPALTATEETELKGLERIATRAHRSAKRVGLDYLMREAEINKRRGEEARLNIDFGDDELYRAATAQQDEDGKWRSLAGKEFSEEAVMSARKQVGNNQFILQQALAHEMSKAQYEQDYDHIAANFGRLQKQMGISDETMNSALIGAGFMQKGKSLQWKHMSNKTQADGSVVTEFAGGKFADEGNIGIGTYQAAAVGHDSHLSSVMVAERAIEVLNDTSSSAKDKADAAATLQTIKEQSDGLKSYVAQQGGDMDRAIADAMRQAGQEPQPGASAASAKAMRKLITLMDNVTITRTATGAAAGANTVSDTLVTTPKSDPAYATELNTAVTAKINATLADPGFSNRVNELNDIINSPTSSQTEIVQARRQMQAYAAQVDANNVRAEIERVVDARKEARAKMEARGMDLSDPSKSTFRIKLGSDIER